MHVTRLRVDLQHMLAIGQTAWYQLPSRGRRAEPRSTLVTTTYDVAHGLIGEESRRGNEEVGFEEHRRMNATKLKKLR